MIHITLPDGSRKPFEENPTGLVVAKSISEGLARECVAMEIDGAVMDLNRTIESDADLRLITTRDDEALEIMRHSAAHVMAQAVLNLYPDAKLTIGPVVEDGFYYDIDMEPLSEEAFPQIEAEMKRIVKAKMPIERREVSKSDALEFYKDEPYKTEMISDLADGTISFYKQGEFYRPVPGTACAPHRFRTVLQTDAGVRGLLAGGPVQGPAPADLRHGLFR